MQATIKHKKGQLEVSELQNKLVAGTNITIDETDPLNPIISSSGGGGSETTTTMGALINSAGAAVPNDTDLVATAENAGLLKKITWTNAKAFLKTYFDTLYAAALGSDDNYVTDAEKTVLSNTSGTNTGDQIVISPAVTYNSTATLAEAQLNNVLVVGANITVTIPSTGLSDNFECSFAVRAGFTVTIALAGGVTAILNTGLTCTAGTFTVKKIGSTNEFILKGDI
jgi:hypothetical protein